MFQLSAVLGTSAVKCCYYQTSNSVTTANMTDVQDGRDLST